KQGGTHSSVYPRISVNHPHGPTERLPSPGCGAVIGGRTSEAGPRKTNTWRRRHDQTGRVGGNRRVGEAGPERVSPVKRGEEAGCSSAVQYRMFRESVQRNNDGPGRFSDVQAACQRSGGGAIGDKWLIHKEMQLNEARRGGGRSAQQTSSRCRQSSSRATGIE